MIKVEHIETFGFEAAVRGMRNPINSWEKSDSTYEDLCRLCGTEECVGSYICNGQGDYIVGENDMGLMKRLYNAGMEHRKFMRQIFVSMDITAPLYWWKEFDTYKVGTTANSCSTMHKIHSKEFTLDDFSHEHLCDHSIKTMQKVIDNLNIERQNFLVSKDKWCWWQMIQLLPTSYNQKRTITMTYENAASMIKQRSGHKLDEWREFVETLKRLPYIAQIVGECTAEM